MFEKLNDVIQNSYAPYSKYKVACILVDSCDNIYTGVNIENASFGATVCAERVAIFKAVSEGIKNFKEMHVLVDDDQIGTCCFLCRQVMTEFFSQDMPIYCYDRLGNIKKFKVIDLCPFPFNKENLR